MVKVCVWLGDTRNTIMCDKGQGNKIESSKKFDK
jgi:hypothetical protein